MRKQGLEGKMKGEKEDGRIKSCGDGRGTSETLEAIRVLTLGEAVGVEADAWREGEEMSEKGGKKRVRERG